MHQENPKISQNNKSTLKNATKTLQKCIQNASKMHKQNPKNNTNFKNASKVLPKQKYTQQLLKNSTKTPQK